VSVTRQPMATFPAILVVIGTALALGMVAALNSGHRKDATGAISSGTTEVNFPLGDIDDWKGLVRFFRGKTDDLTRGRLAHHARAAVTCIPRA